MLHYCVMFLCMCPGTTDNIFYGCVLLWLIICDCNIHNNSSNISQCKMFTCSVTHVRGVHLWSKRCHRWLKRCHLSHLHTCDTGHWTCENFILWYIGGVILPQTHLMQQTNKCNNCKMAERTLLASIFPEKEQIGKLLLPQYIQLGTLCFVNRVLL